MDQWVAVIVLTSLLALVAACYDAPEYRSGCRDAKTREELRQVKDASGALFPVKRVLAELGGLSIDSCGVSADAQLISDGHGYPDVAGVVYHPRTGEEIRVREARRGIYEFRWPSGYEWY